MDQTNGPSDHGHCVPFVTYFNNFPWDGIELALGTEDWADKMLAYWASQYI